MNKAIQGTKRGASNSSSKRPSFKPKTPSEAKVRVLSLIKKHPRIKWVIGIDEVGRGPVAGPVMMCAFACKVQIFKKGLTRHFQSKQDGPFKSSFTDSKQMTQIGRAFWNELIRKSAKGSKDIFFEIGSKDAKFIDKKGISIAIRSIILRLLTTFDKKGIHYENTFVVLDGSLFAPDVYEQITVIKGDAHLEPISLASILAKEHRDAYMKKIALKYPQYGFERHVGYGTKGHMHAIRKYGAMDLHRKTYLKNI